MELLQLLRKEPLMFIVLAVPLLYSVIAHEVAHGWVALKFRDQTARLAGRLTPNPAAHLDPIGTLCLFLVGFGWAKPVPVNYYALKNSRHAFVLLSLAGCIANILIATCAFALLTIPTVASSIAAPFLLIIARINLILGSLNLIPIPPLDGSRVLMSFLPYHAKIQLARIEPYGFFILVILLWTGILMPIVDFIQLIIFRIIALFLGFFG